MLSLTSLTVTTYDVDKLTVTWEFKTTSESLTDYTIDVYRSEAPNKGILPDDYTLVASGISADTASVDDVTVSGLFHPTRTWFYKLNVTKTSTGESALLFDNTPAYIKSYTIDRPTLEIIRRKKLTLDKFSGRPVYLLRRRSYGTRCSICWDATLSRITQDGDTECYGTGIKGGYFPKLEANALLTTAPKYNQITMFGEWMPSDCMMNLVGVPPVKIGDIVVDDAAKRWAIKSVRTVEKGGVLIEQMCQLTLVSPSDILYQLGLD